MAKKKATVLAQTLAAVAMTVDSPIQPRRCRAGFVFEKGKPQRLELEALTPKQIADIEADPYLKVTYEQGEGAQGNENAESRILELEAENLNTTKALEDATSKITILESNLNTANTRIKELQAELEATTSATDEATLQAKKGK